ncbi:hypothetical protein RFI_07276, partial [Reticulomyxa filosa]
LQRVTSFYPHEKDRQAFLYKFALQTGQYFPQLWYDSQLLPSEIEANRIRTTFERAFFTEFSHISAIQEFMQSSATAQQQYEQQQMQMPSNHNTTHLTHTLSTASPYASSPMASTPSSQVDSTVSTSLVPQTSLSASSSPSSSSSSSSFVHKSNNAMSTGTESTTKLSCVNVETQNILTYPTQAIASATSSSFTSQPQSFANDTSHTSLDSVSSCVLPNSESMEKTRPLNAVPPGKENHPHESAAHSNHDQLTACSKGMSNSDTFASEEEVLQATSPTAAVEVCKQNEKVDVQLHIKSRDGEEIGNDIEEVREHDSSTAVANSFFPAVASLDDAIVETSISMDSNHGHVQPSENESCQVNGKREDNENCNTKRNELFKVTSMLSKSCTDLQSWKDDSNKHVVSDDNSCRDSQHPTSVTWNTGVNDTNEQPDTNIDIIPDSNDNDAYMTERVMAIEPTEEHSDDEIEEIASALDVEVPSKSFQQDKDVREPSMSPDISCTIQPCVDNNHTKIVQECQDANLATIVTLFFIYFSLIDTCIFCICFKKINHLISILPFFFFFFFFLVGFRSDSTSR